MRRKVEDLGAQDPELRNSPVAWEAEEETEALREQAPGGPACYFNDKPYAHGTTIKSGDSLLRCSRGLWFPISSSDPDNP